MALDRHTTESWWQAVLVVAELIICERLELDHDEALIRETLKVSFAQDEIDKAMDWTEKSLLSGHFYESLSMLVEGNDSHRIEHPKERLCLSDTMWRALETCRIKGFISPAFRERLLEGILSLDTRDWEDDETHDFIREALLVSAPQLRSQNIKRILSGKAKTQFS